MGFFEKIVKLLKPEIKVVIDKRQTDNRKLVIKDSTVFFGGQKIEKKEVVDKLFEEISDNKEKDTLPFQLIHEDLTDDFIDYEEISIKEKESIKRLKKVLPTEDIECILMARRIVLNFDKNNKGLSEQLLKQLEKNYPKKGKKVYNLISCKYFDEIIIPFIDIFKSEYGEEKHIKEFGKFYKGILDFFPIAIFVGNETTENVLKEEINKRLKFKIPFIRVHAVGEHNIKKIESVTEELEIEERFTVKDNKFITPIGVRAQIYEIRLNKQ